MTLQLLAPSEPSSVTKLVPSHAVAPSPPGCNCCSLFCFQP